MNWEPQLLAQRGMKSSALLPVERRDVGVLPIVYGQLEDADIRDELTHRSSRSPIAIAPMNESGCR